MEKATAVILDLRGFGDKNLGVIFEIQELVHRLPAKTIRVLIDDNTNGELAQSLFREAWQESGKSSVEIDKIVMESIG